MYNALNVRPFQTLLMRLSSSFQYGETLVATAIEQRNRPKKLFKLKVNGRLDRITKGPLYHADIHGHYPHDTFTTCRGESLQIKRPTLDEFTVLMPRKANVMYSKDMWALIGMMDISTGSKVMEAGTGSGALTLLLSRAVGRCGKVISFEVRKDHQEQAMSNCADWENCLRYRDTDYQTLTNIEFYNMDIREAANVVNEEIDAVNLDVVDPHLVLNNVVPLLKPDGIVILYLPNISQIIALSRFVFTMDIPMEWESVTEVTHKDWIIKPAILKWPRTTVFTTDADEINQTGVSSSSCQSQEKIDNANGSDNENRNTVDNNHNSNDTNAEYRDVDFASKIANSYYIARPSHTQNPHTGFLVKLRKSCC